MFVSRPDQTYGWISLKFGMSIKITLKHGQTKSENDGKKKKGIPILIIRKKGA